MARDYDEYAWHFRVLADAQREGKLVFVLGAGVGQPYELPNWSELLADLLLGSGRLPRVTVRPTGPEEETTERKERTAVMAILQHIASDPLIQGAIARAAYPGDRWWDALDKKLGRSAIQHILRKQSQPVDEMAGLSLAHTQPDGTLVRIARMLVTAIATQPSRHLSVLTFNYDSLLDDAVRYELKHKNLDASLAHSISTESAFEHTWLDAGIYIYHLHGYLHHRDSRGPNSLAETILDADSYVPVLRGDHWSWRCMERALTATGHASVFIGLSLGDPSLRYVLTRWGQWQTPMTGVYLASPPRLPRLSYAGSQGSPIDYVDDVRALAIIYRAIQDLYSAVLDRLHLVCYQLSSWDEIPQILEHVERRSGDAHVSIPTV